MNRVEEAEFCYMRGLCKVYTNSRKENFESTTLEMLEADFTTPTIMVLLAVMGDNEIPLGMCKP